MSTPDFFRARLDAMIDLKHPLVILGLPWAQIEKIDVSPQTRQF